MRQHPDFTVPETIRSTVGGLEVILSYNSQLLGRLEKRMEKFYSEGQRMGDIFLGVVRLSVIILDIRLHCCVLG